MTYRSESEALRARADSLEQDLQRQKAEVAEGRAAKAKAQALEQELEHTRAKLAKLERRLEPKPRASSAKPLALALGLTVLAVAGGGYFFFMAQAPPLERAKAAVAASHPLPPTRADEPVSPVRVARASKPTPAGPAVKVVETGTLDKATIRRVIRRHLRQVKYCYERELVKQPKLGGKLVFRWTIGSKGAVTSVTLKSSTMASSAAVDCMLRTIRRWRFPPPAKGPVEISYPFVFRSAH